MSDTRASARIDGEAVLDQIVGANRKKSTSRAIRSAVISPAGIAIITPDGTPRHRFAVAREIGRGLSHDPAGLANLFDTPTRTEHDAEPPVPGCPQKCAQLDAELLRPRQAQTSREVLAAGTFGIRHKPSTSAAPLISVDIEGAHRHRSRAIPSASAGRSRTAGPSLLTALTARPGRLRARCRHRKLRTIQSDSLGSGYRAAARSSGNSMLASSRCSHRRRSSPAPPLVMGGRHRGAIVVVSAALASTSSLGSTMTSLADPSITTTTGLYHALASYSPTTAGHRETGR